MIDIQCGTEQGHPMSPELFKCAIHQLSLDLYNAEAVNAPELKNIKITHLLWADDLILLALDQDGLQQLLDILFSYCIDWGLTVNISKTAVMVFYRSGRLLKESLLFKFSNNNVAPVRENCSSGINFTLSGSTTVATSTEQTEAERSEERLCLEK